MNSKGSKNSQENLKKELSGRIYINSHQDYIILKLWQDSIVLMNE